MSWREQYQKGSFRGAAFITEEVEGEHGRRNTIHEYPQRDEAFVEDMGRANRRFTIQCFVAGDDYFAQRDALIDACEAPGSGTLIHPFRGQITVSVMNCRTIESAGADGGGICTFTIDFAESGKPVSAPVAPDNAAQLAGVASSIEAKAPVDFASRFDVSRLPAFVEEAAASVVGGAVLAASASAALQGGLGPALRAFEAGLRFLPTDAAILTRTPIALGRAVTGFVATISALAGSPRRRVETFTAMTDHALTLKPVVGATPARNRQRSNQAALQALLVTAASVGAVRAIAEIRFPSYDDAVALRDSAADRFDLAALYFADRRDDAAADAIDALRRAMVRDVTLRGGSLERIVSFTAQATLPALTIAQRLYGDPATLVDRADGIVSRNRVRHPGFVPADRPLEVLSDV